MFLFSQPLGFVFFLQQTRCLHKRNMCVKHSYGTQTGNGGMGVWCRMAVARICLTVVQSPALSWHLTRPNLYQFVLGQLSAFWVGGRRPGCGSSGRRAPAGRVIWQGIGTGKRSPILPWLTRCYQSNCRSARPSVVKHHSADVNYDPRR